MKKLLVLGFVAIGLLGFKYREDINTMGLRFVAPSIFGKDNVHSPEAGEIIYDSQSAKFFGRDHNSNWVELSSGASIVPPGLIFPYGGSSAPNGYLPCDGSAVSRTDFADLFAAIGTSFGAGDGVTTFNLPDLRGRFLRGMDGSAGRDPDSATRTAMNAGGNTGNAIGSVQTQSTGSHQHYMFNGGTGIATNSRSVLIGSTNYVAATNWQGGGQWNDYALTASPSNAVANVGITSSPTSGASETRPVNANVNYIIKY